MENPLVAFSTELAAAVERAGRSVVHINARPRLGSAGVHWRPGAIVTAAHTIHRADGITVTLPGGNTVNAALAGRDVPTDIAVLKIDPGALPPIDRAAEHAGTGAIVLAVGRGRESGVNATFGVISAAGGPWRTWRGGLIDRFLRLDISLYPGGSGSAVVDPAGRVLGIATSGLSQHSPIGIPAETVDRVAGDLLNSGYVHRGWLGVGLQPVALPQHLTSRLNLDVQGGLMVVSLEPGGPAERAGVLPGDILIRLGERPARDTEDVQAALQGLAAGTPVKAGVLRGGEPREIDIAVGERPR